MMDLHPEVLSKGGEKLFVVLPYEEFLTLQELLSDAEDLLDLRAAKREEENEPSVPLDAVKERLGL